MVQWFACSHCDFKSEEYPKETRIREMEEKIGYYCPKCGRWLIYNAG